MKKAWIRIYTDHSFYHVDLWTNVFKYKKDLRETYEERGRCDAARRKTTVIQVNNYKIVLMLWNLKQI